MNPGASLPGLLLAFALATGLAACEGVEFREAEYQAVDEIPEGPGLFTGEDGEYILLRQGPAADEAGAEEDGAPTGSDGENEIPEGLPADRRQN